MKIDDYAMKYTYGANAKYPWDEWFSEGGFMIRQGVDYKIPTKSMIVNVRDFARRHGRRIARLDVDRDDGGDVIIVMQDPETVAPMVRLAPLPMRPSTGRLGAPPKYPWDEWLSGPEVTLEQGVHFETSATSMVILARSKAWTRRYPFAVKVRRRGNTVYVSAPIEGDPRYHAAFYGLGEEEAIKAARKAAAAY